MNAQPSPVARTHPQRITLAQWLAQLSEWLDERTIVARFLSLCAYFHAGFAPGEAAIAIGLDSVAANGQDCRR